MSPYSLHAIHELLKTIFELETLNAFCHTHFPDVATQFTNSDNKNDRIQKLLVYANGKGQMVELIKQVADTADIASEQLYQLRHQLQTIIARQESTRRGF